MDPKAKERIPATQRVPEGNPSSLSERASEPSPVIECEKSERQSPPTRRTHPRSLKALSSVLGVVVGGFMGNEAAVRAS
jgi:hypothetical protein